jgi:hypothetical protein
MSGDEHLAAEREERQRQLEQDLDRILGDTMRRGWRLNTTWWIGVVGGSFLLILLILVAVSGG